ncbi:SDR family NAD(P)-dependent oxidoreductase [Bacillus sp. SL00103]
MGLAKQGYTVIAGVRQEANAKKLAEEVEQASLSEAIHIAALDVTDTQSIQAFQKKLHTYAPITLLVNNAGTAYAGFAEEVPVDTYRQQFNVNVFGVMEVTQAVLPFMTNGAKIFNMSKDQRINGNARTFSLCILQVCFRGYTESLRIELASFGIQGLNRTRLFPNEYLEHVYKRAHVTARRRLKIHTPLSKDDGSYQCPENKLRGPA